MMLCFLILSCGALADQSSEFENFRAYLKKHDLTLDNSEIKPIEQSEFETILQPTFPIEKLPKEAKKVVFSVTGSDRKFAWYQLDSKALKLAEVVRGFQLMQIQGTLKVPPLTYFHAFITPKFAVVLTSEFVSFDFSADSQKVMFEGLVHSLTNSAKAPPSDSKPAGGTSSRSGNEPTRQTNSDGRANLPKK
jgi:hypothetical protein